MLRIDALRDILKTRSYMKKSKKNTKTPEDFETVKAASDFWDDHSAADHWDGSAEAAFDVDIKKEPRYVALESGLSKQVIKISRQKGVTPETLINLWVKEKISAK